MNEPDVAIIGGGLTGLSAAYHLSKYGKNVILIEKEKELGGLVSSYPVNKYHIEKYYHHIFRSDGTILKLIDEVGLNDKLEWLKGSTGYYINDKAYLLNTPKEIFQFPYLSLFDKVKLALLVSRSKRSKDDLDNITAKDLILNVAGKSVYENFFEPLLRSKFGNEKDNVSASWLLSRIKIRSDRSLSGERLGYLRGGFYSLIEAILKRIDGSVYNTTSVSGIIIKNNEVNGIEVDGDVIGCDNVISTVSPLALSKIIDEKTINPMGKIKYQGTVCALFALNKRLIDDIYWLNIKADVPFGAVIEHTNFGPLGDYGEHLVYVTSYFQDLNNPLWKMSEEEVIKVYLSGMKKLFPSFDERTIKWWKLARDTDTGPLFETGFKNKVLQYKTKIKGLYLAGMFSPPNYPERSMNGSIRAGFECVDDMLSNINNRKRG